MRNSPGDASRPRDSSSVTRTNARICAGVSIRLRRCQRQSFHWSGGTSRGSAGGAGRITFTPETLPLEVNARLGEAGGDADEPRLARDLLEHRQRLVAV